MGKTLPFQGKAFPSGAAGSLDRIAAFRVTYVAIVCFVVLYVFSVKAFEQMLQVRFQAAVTDAAQVDPLEGPIQEQIQLRVGQVLQGSVWTRIGGVRVTALVLGADGRTPLYVGGRRIPSPMPGDAVSAGAEADLLLPATVDVVVSVPHNSLAANGILIVYAALLIQTLFLYDRRRTRVERARFDAAIGARDETAARAARIEAELGELSRRMEERVEAEVSEEIRSLSDERARLQEKLDALARREHELRAQAGQVQQTLQDERQALEELLDEALSDLAGKDEELRNVEAQLKRASRGGGGRGGRARETEQLGKRLRTLYKNVEIDDNAIDNLVALRDESMKLRAEEAVKRLSDDLESAAVRRKVGGLPAHLTIFELGFAGKGRIYYTNGRQRRFRILLVGAKNTQKPDLEYLSRLPKE
ncbi:MAG: hypothetical protein QNK03_01230 [Myxococcota bacterium]|nr:hypothetical protein [Myxococcota bacterium]